MDCRSFDVRWVLCAALAVGCGDDGSGSASETSAGTGDSTDAQSPPVTPDGEDETGGSSSGAVDDTGDWTCLPPEQGVECEGPSGVHYDFEVRLPYAEGSPDPQDVPCSVFAVVENGELGFREIGLTCQLPPFIFDQIMTLRLRAPDTITTPLRPGRQLRLSAEAVWGLVDVDWNFALRDEATGELAVMGTRQGVVELVSPLDVRRELEVCSFIEMDIDSCISGVAQFEWVVEHEGAEHRLGDGDTLDVGEMTLLSNALEYSVCAGCADVSRFSGVLLGSPHFDDPPVDACDLFAQDCPADARCVPASENPGVWDATVCVPVGDLGQGDACDPADPASPTDLCGAGLVCVADDDPMQGTCRPLCGGSIDAPECESGNECWLDATGTRPPMVCVPSCDPLAQDCAEPRQACLYGGEDVGFACAASGAAMPGEPCENNASCIGGSTCVDSMSVDAEACDGGTPGCCAPFCSLSGDPCPEGSDCVALFDEPPAPQYEDLGACVTR